jgi:hypothetical protein
MKGEGMKKRIGAILVTVGYVGFFLSIEGWAAD